MTRKARKEVPPKPEPVVVAYTDHVRAAKYLEAKYEDHREHKEVSKEYGSFWDWLGDSGSISNGSFVYFHRSELDEIPDEFRVMYGHYLDEFEDADGEVTLWVWW